MDKKQLIESVTRDVINALQYQVIDEAEYILMNHYPASEDLSDDDIFLIIDGVVSRIIVKGVEDDND